MDYKNVAYSPLGSEGFANEAEDARLSALPSRMSGKYHSSSYDLKGAAAPGRAVYRPKKSRIVRWLILHDNGEKQILTLEKRQLLINFNLDIPSRDMRLLDSHFSNYDTIGQISVRDNTIVFSMEHVKALIMADKIIVPLEEDKSEVRERFILYLEQMVQERAAEIGSTSNTVMRRNTGPFGGSDDGAEDANGFVYASSHGGQFQGHEEVLPFELHVLEAALGEICNHLAREVELLQAAAQSALEDLTKDADQPTLERVRRIKTGHQRLNGRVKLVREVLERLMEDDGDMLRMCLTQKAQQRRVAAAAATAPSLSHANSAGMTPPVAVPGLHRRGSSSSAEEAIHPGRQSPGFDASSVRMASRRSHGMPMQSVEEQDVEHDLLDVENLLESYFMLVDSTHQSLETLGEYIDDTEDLINIQLDYSRNKLIRFEIILTTGTFAIAIFSAVAGMLGENLALPEVITMNFWGFALVNLGVLLFCVATFLMVFRLLVTRKII